MGQLQAGRSINFDPIDGRTIAAFTAVPAVETAVIVLLLFPFLLSAWGRFAIVRASFGINGRLPFRLMRFLARAHRLGVLRQAGAVYQFRHIAIRDALAKR